MKVIKPIKHKTKPLRPNKAFKKQKINQKHLQLKRSTKSEKFPMWRGNLTDETYQNRLPMQDTTPQQQQQ